MTKKDYLGYLIVAALFFIGGWVGSSYLGTPESQPQGQPQESERIHEFLFGEVYNIEMNEEEVFIDLQLDLSASFEQDSKLRNLTLERSFLVEDGVTNFYEVDSRNVDEGNRQESSFDAIAEGDNLAVKATLPPATVEEVFSYGAFTLDQALIIREAEEIEEGDENGEEIEESDNGDDEDHGDE